MAEITHNGLEFLCMPPDYFFNTFYTKYEIVDATTRQVGMSMVIIKNKETDLTEQNNCLQEVRE